MSYGHPPAADVPGPPPPRVVIVHHQLMIRLGIAAMLETAPGVELLGHGDTPAVVPRAPGGSPALDVLVAAAPATAGGAVSELIRELDGRVPVLTVCSGHPGADGGSAGGDGPLGCVTADATRDELTAAVHAVARRERYVPAPPAAASPLVDAAARGGRRRGCGPDGARLSPRERQALALIAQGYTHFQVARRMGVAKTTVETYVQRIRDKLALGNKADLTRAALMLGAGTWTGG